MRTKKPRMLRRPVRRLLMWLGIATVALIAVAVMAVLLAIAYSAVYVMWYSAVLLGALFWPIDTVILWASLIAAVVILVTSCAVFNLAQRKGLLISDAQAQAIIEAFRQPDQDPSISYARARDPA